MTFVFPLLLGGLVLTGIPVLLHLIVRQKPKRLPFPAFRFLVQQQRSNLRKLRLRHLLLLALRVFLIAAMCLLLARPRLFHEVLGLDGERPVQAALVFDTSASMEYRSSDGKTRLAQAQQRGHELLNELPAGSQVAVVDSANAHGDQPLKWLSVLEARKRIDNLKVRYANAPVSQALLKALDRLDQVEPGKSERAGPPQMKLVAVLSDRTRGCWDGGQLPGLIDKLDRLPPMYDGLLAARGQIGPLKDKLAEMRGQLQSGKDFGAQALTEALTALQDDLVALRPERDSWPVRLPASVQQVRRLCREMRTPLVRDDLSSEDAAAAKLAPLPQLGSMLRYTAGAQLLFVDVGIDSPVDVLLGALELPRTSAGIEQQVFAAGDTFTVRVMVQAVGKDAPVKLVCQVGNSQQEFPIEAKAGQRQLVPFNIGAGELKLVAGDNPIEVRIAADRAALPHSQHRFATVRVRPKRKVIVLVDDTARADNFVRTLAALGYAPEARSVKGISKDALAGAAAVYLLGVAAPEETLWRTLGEYVKTGGGLGVVPAGGDLSVKAYADPAALALLPGKIDRKVENAEGAAPGGSEWDWAFAKYTHSFMKGFKAWKDYEWTDFMRLRRGASAYWDVKAPPSAVLVRYDDAQHKPAVLEGAQGRTLLFTTPLDEQQPAWNNYHENITSFYLAVLMQATGYLAGESTAPQLNFTLGHGDPVVALPAGPPLEVVADLRGPELLRKVTLEPGRPQLALRDLAAPGNYQLDGKTKDGEVRRIVAFSLNVPASEADLAKVPGAEIVPLFAGNAIVSPGPDVSLHDVLQSYRSEPLDLMPYFMLALLLALALENLLANKFYRRVDGT